MLETSTFLKNHLGQFFNPYAFIECVEYIVFHRINQVYRLKRPTRLIRLVQRWIYQGLQANNSFYSEWDASLQDLAWLADIQLIE